MKYNAAAYLITVL